MLIVDSILYFLLAMYFDNVIPGKEFFSGAPDRGIGCFTLCKKFVISHRLSHTGTSLVALLFFSICGNYFEMLHHKRFPMLDSFCIS